MEAHNPLHANIPKIFMVAILRQSDKVVVATYSVSKDVTKEGVRQTVSGNSNIIANKRYTSQGDMQAIHYILDTEGRIFSLVTNSQYPARIAFTAIEDLQTQFAEFNSQVAGAKEESLTKSTRLILKDFVEKWVLKHILALYTTVISRVVLLRIRYADPSKADKLTAVQEKLEVVKDAMKENIQQILANEEKVERIDAAAEHLNEQAQAFKSNTKALANKM